MKIFYSKKQRRMNLGLGLLYLFIGILDFATINQSHWIGYIWLLLGILYLFITFTPYITIENNKIAIEHPFRRKIDLNTIKGIRKFAGDYTFITNKGKKSINTQIIDLKDLDRLNKVLAKLDIEWK